MSTPTKRNLHGCELGRGLLPGLPIRESCNEARRKKSVLILQFLRKKARGSRSKRPRTFYSIRAVASRFDVPTTTVSRIYTQLKSEGLLTTIWGSKTFVTPVQVDNQLRIRAVIALPASLVSFCTLRQYRNFFLEMRDALWKVGFATRLLFYEGNETQSPSFAGLLLSYKPDIVLWFRPNPKPKETIARLLDRGIRVITVGDWPGDCDEHSYCIDRERAIKNALFNWKQNGVRSVTVLQDSCCASASRVALVEKCVRDMAMPHVFANAESCQLHDTLPACAQRVNRAIIFPLSELAIPLTSRDPGGFAKLSEESRILLLDGPIDLPGLSAVRWSSDIVEVDLHSVAKRIASDLTRSTRSWSTEPLVFQAKWVPGAIANRAPQPHSIQSPSVAQAHRPREVRIAV